MKMINRILARASRQRTSVKDDFRAFLRQRNCQWSERVDEETKITRFVFDYQGGHFIAEVRDTNRGVDVNYPAILDTDVADLPQVRALCNHFNASNTILKFVYAFNDDENRLVVHESFFADTIWPDELANSMSACFYYQRMFCNELNEFKQAAAEAGADDMEAAHHDKRRELVLVRELEISHQPGAPADWHCAASAGPDIAQILQKTLGLKKVDLESVTLNNTSLIEKRRLDSPDLLPELMSQCGEKPFTLTVKMTTGDETPRCAIVNFMPDTGQETAGERYYCVTAALIPPPHSRTSAINAESQMPESNSVVMAWGGADRDKLMAEFDYMWKDVAIRRRDGEPLDEPQQLIADVAEADVAYNMYWGRKLMLAGRHYEALAHMENAFNAQRTRCFDLGKSQREAFFDLCYYIGVCYADLGLYRDAYYYLDYLRDSGNILHATALVNVMANGKDFRLFDLTSDLTQAISRQYDHDEDIPEGWQSFLSFLRRRRAYALIDHSQLDEAEKMFTAMLDEPESRDYALDELAYIKRLRGSSGSGGADGQGEAESTMSP